MSSVKLKLSRGAYRLAQGVTKDDRERAMSLVTLAALADVEKYAPSTSANVAPLPFYVRGEGMRLKNGRSLMNSERMSVRWSYNSSNLKKAVIENIASYAPFVIGERQAKFHKRRGWLSVPKYAKDQKNVDRLGEIYAEALLKDIV